MKLQSPGTQSTTTALIAGIHRGGLSYHTVTFIGIVILLEGDASRMTAELVRRPRPLRRFACMTAPSLMKNSLRQCPVDDSVPQRTVL